MSNQSGKVAVAIGLTLGGGSIAEINTGGVRALTLAHDVGTNLVCGQVTVLSLDAATGAFVQGALHASGSCSIGGQLTVNGTNILDALASAGAASTAPVGIADVTGLTAALAGKQAVLSSASSLQLDNLTCPRLKPATGQISNCRTMLASCSWGYLATPRRSCA